MLARFFSAMRRLVTTLFTLLLVTLITCAIWLYAMQKNVHDQPPQNVFLRFGTDDERKEYVITPQDPIKVGVTFRSSNSQLDLLLNKVRQAKDGWTIPLSQIPADHKLDVKAALLGTLFKDSGASNLKLIDEGQGSVAVAAEKQMDFDLPLEEDHKQLILSPGTAPELTSNGQPVKQIRLRAPERLAKRLAVAHALVNLNKLNSTGAKPGETIRGSRPVEIPNLAAVMTELGITTDEARRNMQSHVVLTPADVDVALILEQTTLKRTLDRLTIQIAAPPALLEKYTFEIHGDGGKNFLTDLHLIGSREAVDAVTANAKKTDNTPKLVWAVIRITPEDHIPTNGDLEKEVEIITPPGVSLDPAETTRKVQVHATRR